MLREKEEPDDLRMPAFYDLFDGEDISKRLGHLLLVDVDEPVVDPVPGKGLSCGGLGLGDFILMVGEDEVSSASMDVEGFTEVFLAHHGALDVPAGPSLAPWALPPRFSGLACL